MKRHSNSKNKWNIFNAMIENLEKNTIIDDKKDNQQNILCINL